MGPGLWRGFPEHFFFRGTCHVFSEKRLFCRKKRPCGERTCRTTGAGSRQTSAARPPPPGLSKSGPDAARPLKIWTCRKFWRVRRRECLKLDAAKPLGAAGRPEGAARPEAAGRPKSGFFQKCPQSLRGVPGAPPESPGAPGAPDGALGAKGPKNAPWGPWGPLGPPWAPSAPLRAIAKQNLH